jgi:hypothetical protein
MAAISAAARRHPRPVVAYLAARRDFVDPAHALAARGVRAGGLRVVVAANSFARTGIRAHAGKSFVLLNL